jgi:AcrR family transcriptional regulator
VAFYRATEQVLAVRGSAGVSVDGLCAAVGVTKGSFYHHFGSMSRFVAEFAKHWERVHAARLSDYAVVVDPLRRLESVHARTISRVHATEVAVRAWAVTEPALGASLSRMDTAGETHLTRTLSEIVHDSDRAATLARMGIGLGIGLIERQQPFDPEHFTRIAVTWVRDCIGLHAETVRTGNTWNLRLAQPAA